MRNLYHVGRFIKERRKLKGYTQQELAELVGYASKVAISDLERGKTNLPKKKISELAKALGLDESELRVMLVDNVSDMPGPHGEELDGKDPGEIVRIYREARGLTREELAKQANLPSQSYVTDLEEKKPTAKYPAYIAAPVANVLGIPEIIFCEYIKEQIIKFELGKIEREINDKSFTDPMKRYNQQAFLKAEVEVQIQEYTSNLEDFIRETSTQLRLGYVAALLRNDIEEIQDIKTMVRTWLINLAKETNLSDQ